MKGGFAVTALAAMVGGANAVKHGHAHELFAHKRGAEAESCGCTTIYTTITGEPTLCPPPPPTTSAAPPTTETTPTEAPVPTATSIKPITTSTEKLPVPTPEPITCPTPGTYTFTATTVTLSETTTVCVGSSTRVPSGTHTVGGVTTVVETATTVTCPVATVTTGTDGVVHSTITSTEYVCPSSGTYTIAPITTTVTEECDVKYPVPTSYNPGTYTAPEQVITVTETGFVTVCPYTSFETPKPTPVPEPTSQAAPPPPPATTKEAPSPKPQLPKPQPPKGTTTDSGKFDGSFGNNGDQYGITYTPYDGKTGECKAAWQVETDIREIKNDGFQVIRVYSTDCDTLPNVGAACKKHDVQMILGLFVKETGCKPDTPEIKEQIDSIAEWAQWDLVELFIVGNEALMNGFCQPEELRTLIQTVKSKCSGYNGPYTIAEPVNSWLDTTNADALCDVVDFTGANIHPFFNAATVPSSAGTFVKGQLAILDGICSGKKGVNLECGWPTDGNCLGQACPGAKEQAEALKTIREQAGGRTVFFSFENDAWKDPGPNGVEQFWGIKDYFRLA